MRRTRSAPSIRKAVVAAVAVVLAIPAAALAQVPPQPIPESPETDPPAQFTGTAATPRPISATLPPAHPFMAANGRSNIHDDPYMTDTHAIAGPLGDGTWRTSTFLRASAAR